MDHCCLRRCRRRSRWRCRRLLLFRRLRQLDWIYGVESVHQLPLPVPVRPSLAALARRLWLCPSLSPSSIPSPPLSPLLYPVGSRSQGKAQGTNPLADLATSVARSSRPLPQVRHVAPAVHLREDATFRRAPAAWVAKDPDAVDLLRYL
jgi:hypothetical protein